MKIYVSGKISGLDAEEVKARFYGAEALLQDIGFEVVNPLKNGLDDGKSWAEHLAKDIEMLLDCDAIYLMANWVDSLGAKIEHDVAKRMGMYFLHEQMIDESRKEIEEAKKKEYERIHSMVIKVEKAIFEATGMKFNQYVTKSRKRDGFFARMIFVHHCRKEKMKLTRIAQYIHRDHSSILHLLNKYEDEIRFNPDFRYIATKVESILNGTKS